MEGVKAPDAFSFEEPNTPQRWARWMKQFVTYFDAAELDQKPKKVQVARLLNAAGVEAQEIHELFIFANDNEKLDYEVILGKFTNYCRPKKNVIYERHMFWSRDQKEGEQFDRWLKDLRIMAKDCEFAEEDNMIRDKIVFSVCDKRVQERMLRNSDLKLKDAVDICRAAESSQKQLADIRKTDSVPISAVASNQGARRNQLKCFTCEKPGHMARDCPRKEDKREEGREELKCFNCQGMGHVSLVCPSGDNYPRRRKKKSYRGRGRGSGARQGGSQVVHELAENMDEYASEFSSLSLLSIHVSSVADKRTRRFARFRFHDLALGKSVTAELKIDSGAEANVMTLQKYKELFPDRVGQDGKPLDKYLQNSSHKLEAYGGAAVSHFGTVNLPCQYGEKKFMCRFFLCDIDGSMLLGLPTCEALGIVSINITNDVCELEEVQPEPTNESAREASSSVNTNHKEYIHPSVPIAERPTIRDKQQLRQMYPECFNQSNKHFLNFEYDIKMNPSASPKVHPPRRVPLEIRDKVKVKLEEMESKGVISKVNDPTSWVNSLVVETKANGELRLCLDPTDLNKDIMREYHPIPVVDDIVPELNGSDLFTKLDLKDGYWHIKLTKAASYLTTFSTPFGKYRYNRLPFGLCVSQDVFQRKVDETYGSCEGAIGISDDITCHGKGDGQHDPRLHNVMEQTRKANLCLNYDKLIVKKPAVKFFGNVFSAEGVRADPDKIKAITALRAPRTKSEVKSFLGMVNYLQKFLPRLSEHTKVLRSLERKGVHFVWDAEHQESFDRIKSMLSEDMILAYYDRKQPVTLQCDYSENGLGVALVQNERPVLFASKALVGSELNYSPIEGEMLGAVYGIKKFHNYLYGRKFTIECDHKPLQDIKKKNLNLAPPRLRGMLQSVSDYDYTIRYRPGKEMVLPDALSRLSCADKSEVSGTRMTIHELVDVSQSRLERLQRECEADVVQQKIKKLVRTGWPARRKSLEHELRPYWSMRHVISVVDGLIMAGSRIIIPEQSRSQVLQEIHEGHQGITKCTLRAKNAVYWPGMYNEIRNVVGNCGACKEFENAQTKCPMIITEIPPQPWYTVGADLFQFKGRWHLLVTDIYSKAPFVRPLPNSGSYATIRAMKSIFTENGIPLKVVSDNGTHFTGGEYKRFASKWGFEMVLSSPEYPQGHALIERHIQTVKKCMWKCDVSGYDLDLALLVLRSTPLAADLPSPAELLQGRKFRTTLPTHVPNPQNSESVQKALRKRQDAAAARYDMTAKSKPELVQGQSVRLYNKGSRRWEPAMITGYASTPRSYYVERMAGGAPLRRNRVHLRSTPEVFQRGYREEDEEDDGDSTGKIPPLPESVDAQPSIPDHGASDSEQPHPDELVPRRSQRVRKAPDRYMASH